jgi:hypothetical protein
MTDRFEPKEEDFETDDYRAFFESHILRVWHLQGKARVYQIARVTALTSVIVDKGVRKMQRQPKLELATRQGKALPLPLLLNKTNAKAIAQLYGKRPADWVGKWIELYPTTTEVGGEVRDCIRVRNQIPAADRPERPRKQNKQAANALPPASEPAPLDHDRSRGRNDDDPDTLEAEYEVVQ